jgi:hypothetical protein
VVARHVIAVGTNMASQSSVESGSRQAGIGNAWTWLRWLAPWLAAAAIFMPAISLTAPLYGQLDYSALGIIATTASGISHSTAPGGGARGPNAENGNNQPSLTEIVREVQRIRRHLGATGTTPAALRLTASLPVAILLAALMSLLLLLFTGLRWWKAAGAVSIAGLVAALYTLACSWWVTRAAQADVRKAFQNAGGSFHLRSATELMNQLARQVKLTAGPALLLWALAFTAVLVLPFPESHGDKPSSPPPAAGGELA